ncbi:hypothetical protein ACVWWK_007464 [Bradyrhizobium sp. LB9.1b]
MPRHARFLEGGDFLVGDAWVDHGHAAEPVRVGLQRLHEQPIVDAMHRYLHDDAILYANAVEHCDEVGW